MARESVTTYSHCKKIRYVRPNIKDGYYVINSNEKTRRQIHIWKINNLLKHLFEGEELYCDCELCKTNNFLAKKYALFC